MWKRSAVAVAILGFVLVGCGDSAKPKAAITPGGGSLKAQFASFDVSVGREQRVVVGLQTDAGLVSFGSAMLSFAYLGTSPESDKPQPGPAMNALWIPVAGQRLPTPLPAQAPVVRASEGVGVYGATARFDHAGYWRVTVEVSIDGKVERAEAPFAVNPKPTGHRRWSRRSKDREPRRR